MAPPSKTSIMLVTGEYFDHLAPDPSVITLDVIEHGLDVPRFNNQTIRPITVLEHSLRVRRIACELWDGPAVDCDDLCLWALLHDAHEALVPWGDCLRPGKTVAMRAAEMFVDAALFEALGISGLSTRVHETVKTSDEIALYFEARLWQPGAIDWAPEVLPAQAIADMSPLIAVTRAQIIDRFMPLIPPRPGECWRLEVESLLPMEAPARTRPPIASPAT